MTARVQRLLRGGWFEIALALGVGYAIYTLANSIASVLTGVISQHVSQPSDVNSPFALLNLFSGDPFALNFHLGKTVVVYGYALGALLALLLVLAVRAALNAYARRDQLPCPHCLTMCPIEATVCRSCSLEMVDEAEPEEETRPELP